ncbi:uncharacterized protein LOC141901538 [Tubulanus polymorphus]|uniref:uncharacterized protein LOC141901538 n=1 Tax=Tubulanus polymorphus TaxID=672921 RepID=UPI003DA6678C
MLTDMASDDRESCSMRRSMSMTFTENSALQCITDEFLQSDYKQCFICRGFYGPNFSEPVCATCHAFLFPQDINNTETPQQFQEKSDSCDSGNEEPEKVGDFYIDKTVSQAKIMVVYPPKTDKLAERLAMLTVPREYSKEKAADGLFDSLPPEVLLVVFKHLDDISLWTARNVCPRWRLILDAETTEDQWEQFINLRWPLFYPHYKVKSWRKVYEKLLMSAPCRSCLENMMLQMPAPIEENSWRHRRLRSELKSLKTDPPEGIQATPLDRQCCHWQASITGPQGSPYEGGMFYLYLQIPHSYPMMPPLVRFITKIFHPNISRHGDVGLDSIHHNWSLALTISKVLISIQSLLTDPYCYVCMEPDIGKLYRMNHKTFDKIACLWTWKYAMHDYIIPVDVPISTLHL